MLKIYMEKLVTKISTLKLSLSLFIYIYTAHKCQTAMVCTANDLQKWKGFPKGLRVLIYDESSLMNNVVWSYELDSLFCESLHKFNFT